jgi:hypothetical protein
MRLAQNITRVAAQKLSCSANNTSLSASQIPNRKYESTAVKPIITTPKDGNAYKHPSVYSSVTLSERVAIDGASCSNASCVFAAALCESAGADIHSTWKEDYQKEESTEAEQPNKVSKKPPNAGDYISLRWDVPASEDIQRKDTPLSLELSLESFDDYCFETPSPKAGMMRTPLFPPPTPRHDHAMIQCIRPPIPEKLLLPVL